VVAFSALAVVTGLSGLLFFEGSYLRAMGLGGAIVVVLAALFALTALPALLSVLGPRIHAGRLPVPGFGLGEGFWHRAAARVMRRPLAVLLPTLAVLLCMGIPFFHLRMTASDVRVLPEQVEARRGYELLRRIFPDQARTRMLVAVSFPTAPALTRERVGALVDLSRRLAALPGVLKVESIVDTGLPLSREAYQGLLTRQAAAVAVAEPGLGMALPPEVGSILEAAKQQSVGAQVVLLSALTDLAPETEEARELVRRIREARRVADGTLLVGGPTANDIDTTAYIVERAPRAVAFVSGVTLIVLFLLLGSVLLPLKAVLMNFVSIAGSFGALVWVFQDGNLFVGEGRPIEPSLPVLLFCILFGLSMDYEVLMLSRIKESYERTGDNTHAVGEGLEKSARLITSAALIMVAVFSAFALARVVIIQAVGFGMALAVTLDATLVRLLLVPSTMRLLGHMNWWAPRPLLALRRKLGAGGVRP
jgi:RND superfamily putative drug exporter